MKKILVFMALWGIALTALPQELLPVWAKSFGGPEWDMANAMCISPKGDVIVAGTYSDSITIDGNCFYSKGYTDLFIAKYDVEGNPLGAFTIGGIGNDRALFSVYSSNLVLLIQFQNPLEIKGDKIDSTGLVNYMAGWFDEEGYLLNSSTISSTSDLQISGMNSDSDGAVYLTGWYSDTLRIDGQITAISPAGTPLFLQLQDKGKSRSVKSVAELNGRQINACTFDSGNKLMIAGTTIINTDKDAKNPDIVYQSLYNGTMNQGGKASDMQEIIKGVELQPVSIVKLKQCTWIAAKFKYYCLNGADTLK
jgi:hypothetical protein